MGHSHPQQEPSATSAANAAAGAQGPEHWLAAYGDALYRVALSRCRDPNVAEDVVQETLLAALKASLSGVHPENERAWLMGILRHKLVDQFRQHCRETPFSDLELLREEDTEAFTAGAFRGGSWTEGHAPQPWPSPDQCLQNAEFWQVFERCLSRLPVKVRQVFVLREMDDAASEEICKDLGVSANNLWVMLHRARLALRRCLEKNWFIRAVK